jgi:hypothetical protein
MSVRGESGIGLSRSGTQEGAIALTHTVFNSEVNECFKRTSVEQGMGVYTTASAP